MPMCIILFSRGSLFVILLLDLDESGLPIDTVLDNLTCVVMSFLGFPACTADNLVHRKATNKLMISSSTSALYFVYKQNLVLNRASLSCRQLLCTLIANDV